MLLSIQPGRTLIERSNLLERATLLYCADRELAPVARPDRPGYPPKNGLQNTCKNTPPCAFTTENLNCRAGEPSNKGGGEILEAVVRSILGFRFFRGPFEAASAGAAQRNFGSYYNSTRSVARAQRNATVKATASSTRRIVAAARLFVPLEHPVRYRVDGGTGLSNASPSRVLSPTTQKLIWTKLDRAGTSFRPR